FWSLDPSGVERISADRALSLGFPALVLTMEALLSSWAPNVYTGLREFHQVRNFNPDGQDLAQHLGFPLYEM
ncbi:hypothetical protein C8J57DRAFT_1004593, partial [Mycena rebaudengoi]